MWEVKDELTWHVIWLSCMLALLRLYLNQWVFQQKKCMYKLKIKSGRNYTKKFIS